MKQGTFYEVGVHLRLLGGGRGGSRHIDSAGTSEAVLGRIADVSVNGADSGSGERSNTVGTVEGMGRGDHAASHRCNYLVVYSGIRITLQ